MTFCHHPDEATLLSYNAGCLDEAFAIVVASHFAMCGAWAAEQGPMSGVGGALLDQLEETPVEPMMFDRLMVEIGDLDLADPPPLAVEPAESDLPAPLADLIGGSLKDIRWKWVGPGMETALVPLSPGAKGTLRFLRIAPGRKMPEHGHGDQELTLVLSGAYTDCFGVFGPGCVADLDEDVEHQPVVTSKEPCVCVVATLAPTRFRGVVPRLLQPLIGI